MLIIFLIIINNEKLFFVEADNYQKDYVLIN